MTQDKALALLKSGVNIFLTGSAGTGKTHVLKSFIKHLNKFKIPTGITASTGIAATHINGQTIHSWIGMGIKDQMNHKDLHFLMLNKTLKKKLEKAKVLIIDEISMLHQKQLNLVNEILKYANDSLLPFGGKQIVVCGDFFQLPPIGNGYEQSKDKFAFMGSAWVDAAFNICYLSKQYRQSKNELGTILDAIRCGDITKNISKILDKTIALNNDLTNPIRLYTHNADVDRINSEELEKIDSRPKNFWASTKGKKELVEVLKKSVIVNEKLSLKVGAKVMFVKNNHDKGYINGTLGKIIEFSNLGFPVVKTSFGEEITATTEEWSIDDESGTSIASLVQIPLRLAWAITIHKSQGMTLDSAELDLRKTFEKGQGYVALSRLRSIEKLKLLGYNEIALSIDSLALKADKRFRELSENVNQLSNLDTLEKAEKEFKLKVGALKFIK